MLGCSREPGLLSAEVRAGPWPPGHPLSSGGARLCVRFVHNRSSEEGDAVSLLQIRFQLDEKRRNPIEALSWELTM